MIINRENYEAFLLDLIEGNLSDDQKNILKHFLNENPDLTVEDNPADIRLPDSGKISVTGTGFPLKEELKKGGLNREINVGNYEQFCIARLEGDLSARTENRLEKFLSENPGLGKSADIFGLTILKADSSVVFPGKNVLRKGRNATITLKEYFNRRFIYKAVSIAASVTILISVFNFLSDDFMTYKTYNQDDQIVNISENKSAAPGSETVPASDTSQDKILIETTDVAGREFGESTRPLPSVPLPSVTKENEPVISHQYASRAPVLLPAKNIMPMEIKNIRADYSFEIVRPLQTDVNHMEPQYAEYERSGAGKILNGLLAFATRNVDDNEDAGGLNLWNIADAGFRGINSLTGADLRLEREFNQEGELVSMAFSSRVLEFRRTSSKDN
jgi:hypothetical protein